VEIKNRQKLLLIIAGAGLLLLVADSLIVSPLTAGWQERSKHIKELKASIADGTATLNRESAYRSTWEQMQTNALSANLSVAEDTMIKAVSRWVRDSRINQIQIRPQWKDSGEDYTAYECHADYNGSIDTISRFLYELERDPISHKIDSVDLSSRDDNGRQLSLSIQFSGLVLTSQESQ
jgi:hypothetical protein